MHVILWVIGVAVILIVGIMIGRYCQGEAVRQRRERLRAIENEKQEFIAERKKMIEDARNDRVEESMPGWPFIYGYGHSNEEEESSIRDSFGRYYSHILEEFAWVHYAEIGVDLPELKRLSIRVRERAFAKLSLDKLREKPLSRKDFAEESARITETASSHGVSLESFGTSEEELAELRRKNEKLIAEQSLEAFRKHAEKAVKSYHNILFSLGASGSTTEEIAMLPEDHSLVNHLQTYLRVINAAQASKTQSA